MSYYTQTLNRFYKYTTTTLCLNKWSKSMVKIKVKGSDVVALQGYNMDVLIQMWIKLYMDSANHLSDCYIPDLLIFQKGHV